MPIIKVVDSSKALLIVRELTDKFIKTPNNELFCKICSAIANCEKRYQGSSKHKKLLTVIAGDSKQHTLANAMPNLNKEFKSELVEAFLAADIPLLKINNPKIRQLFTKLGQPVPSESSCRVHMSKLAEKEV